MIRVGFVLQGKIGIAWYGSEITRDKKDELLRRYGSVDKIQPTEFGVDYFEGIALKNDRDMTANDLSIRYYFPEEESPEDLGDDRLVDLARTRVIVRQCRRRKCDPGFIFLGGGDFVEGYREIIHFETGFMPPFNPDDLLLLVDDLKDMGYDGYILGDIWYMGKERAFSEAGLFYDRRLPSRILEDECSP